MKKIKHEVKILMGNVILSGYFMKKYNRKVMKDKSDIGDYFICNASIGDLVTIKVKEKEKGKVVIATGYLIEILYVQYEYV